MQSSTDTLFNTIASLLSQAKNQVLRNINLTMVQTYFEIGRLIVEHEQQGAEKATYGKETLKILSDKLQLTFGKGFSEVNLRQMRAFYLAYVIQQTPSAKLHNSPIGQTPSDLLEIENPIQQMPSAETITAPIFTLSYSHYLKLMRIKDLNERSFYEIEATKNNWSLKELQRQYDTALYTRLALSRDASKIKELSEKGQIIEQPKDSIKDPYIFEFLELKEHHEYSESDLETKLISKLEDFLLELGTGFTFVARQKRIAIEEKQFRIDLVFYNRILKSFVLIDLKIGEMTHQDIGQMQMYVNYYDRFVKLEDENKTIGIILCQDKSDMLVEITLPDTNQQIFASRYQTVLPSKEDLKKLLSND
jgi:predicted nuclease of restriction endonuclease-like (RecB) superfamily